MYPLTHYETSWPVLRSLLERFEEGDGGETVDDLVNEVDALLAEDQAPYALQTAVDTYRREKEEDCRVWGERGDWDAIEDQFTVAVRAVVGMGEERTVETKAGERTVSGGEGVPTVDLMPVLRAATLEEMCAVGGRMIRLAGSQADLDAIQRALKERGAELDGTPEGRA